MGVVEIQAMNQGTVEQGGVPGAKPIIQSNDHRWAGSGHSAHSGHRATAEIIVVGRKADTQGVGNAKFCIVHHPGRDTGQVHGQTRPGYFKAQGPVTYLRFAHCASLNVRTL